MPVTAYRNPVIPGFNPDPTVIRVGEDFFLVTSSFEYFPGLPIYHSKDLTSWNLIGHALTRPSQLDLRTCEGSSGVFAPTLRFHEGRYYITVCALHKKAGEGPGLVRKRSQDRDVGKHAHAIPASAANSSAARILCFDRRYLGQL